MKFLGEFLGAILGTIALEIVFPLLAMSYCVACFVVFDAFHITNLGAQVLVAISPAVALAIYLVRTRKPK